MMTAGFLSLLDLVLSLEFEATGGAVISGVASDLFESEGGAIIFGYNRKYPVTINPNSVGSDLKNFPLMVSVDNSMLFLVRFEDDNENELNHDVRAGGVFVVKTDAPTSGKTLTLWYNEVIV